MSRISSQFEKARKEKRALLIPYLTAGYPSLENSEEIFKVLAKDGADIIEIGIPFSDPLADGPTIQKASEVALARCTTTEDVFQLIKNLRKHTKIPLVAMTYYNIFYKYGLTRFADKAEDAGLDGVIIPDLPPEEAKDWLQAAKGKLETIFLLAPTSSGKRIEEIADYSEGFVYCVSLTGVTGARNSLPDDLSEFVSRVRRVTKKPLAIGFGVSGPRQAKSVVQIADGVIIGSAFINAISKTSDLKGQIAGVRMLLEQVMPALKK